MTTENDRDFVQKLTWSGGGAGAMVLGFVLANYMPASQPEEPALSPEEVVGLTQAVRMLRAEIEVTRDEVHENDEAMSALLRSIREDCLEETVYRSARPFKEHGGYDAVAYLDEWLAKRGT